MLLGKYQLEKRHYQEYRLEDVDDGGGQGNQAHFVSAEVFQNPKLSLSLSRAVSNE